MNCDYCQSEIVGQPIREHFIPRCVGGKNGKNVYNTCWDCDNLKDRHVFWSIESFKDYRNKKKANPSLSYRSWLRDRIKRIMTWDERREFLIKALD